MACLLGTVRKETVFSGGAAFVADDPGAAPEALASRDDEAWRLAREAFVESLAKAVAAELRVVPGAREILISGRTSKAAGSTPRSGTLASVPVVRLGTSTTTNSSAEATGPAGVRSTPGASFTMRVASISRPLDISVSLPVRSTSATSGDVPRSITRRNPSAMERTATKTATTHAKPTTATLDGPSRSRRLRRFIAVTAAGTGCETM